MPSTGAGNLNLYGTRNVVRKITDSSLDGDSEVPTYANSVRTASAAYPVLLVKEDDTDVTSFVVNGLNSTVLGEVLTKLQLSPGAKTSSSTYLFYRVGYANPLMFYDVDPTAGYDPDNTSTTGICTEENSVINFGAYPNPVTNSSLSFVFNKADSRTWVITIMNETGQVVQTMPVSQSEGPVQMNINLPSNLTNGIYFYNMANAGISVAQGKFILSR